MKTDPIIFIFGAGSHVSRNTFKNLKNYQILGFSRFSKISDITEYPTVRFKNIKTLEKKIDEIKPKKIVLVFMEALSISNLILNKSATEILEEIKVSIINPHSIVKMVLPIMIRNRWGRIIFGGSSRGLKSDVGISGYVSAKYASLGYCKSLSKEYARLGITSNYLSLGLFKSPLLDKIKKNDLENILRNTDTRGLGDCLSISHAIDFIIKSKYVTGSVIQVDGGFS